MLGNHYTEFGCIFRWKVLPKYLQEIDSLKWNTSTTILGETVALPICASPSGFHKLVHKMGELETVKGIYANKHARKPFVPRGVATEGIMANTVFRRNMAHEAVFHR